MKRSLFAELKRRNVFRAGILYIGVVWALSQGIAQVLPVFDVSNQVVRWLITAGVVGFPFWIAFAWFYELTPEGLKRESEIVRHESITRDTSRKLDFMIIGVLGVAVVLLLTDRFVLRQSVNKETPPAIPDKSIAVLPFVNMSDDKANEYFSDGISEELLNLLAKIPNLQVTARTSSFSFKGKEIGIPEIAKTLHVAHILEGSVRKSGNQVRISAQLIRTANDAQLWSQTYDRQLDDIFKTQDEIAAAVVEQLRIKLLGAAPRVKPVDPKAYPLILQAQALTDQSSAKGLAQAVEVLQQALALAPNESRVWSGLARAYMNQTLFGLRPVAEGVQLTKEAANKALELDPENGMAHGSLSRSAADFEYDLPTAARHLQQMLAAEPGDLTAINTVAVVMTEIGRTDEALPLFEYRLAHDPANPIAYNNLGDARYAAKQWDAAIESYRAALRLSPEFAGARAAIGDALLLGKRDAVAALKEFELESDEAQRMQGAPLALHALGRTQEADTATKAFLEKYGNKYPGYIATIYAYRGQVDLAFEFLNRAADLRAPDISRVLSEPLFDSLHGDPRWLQFLHRIGRAPEQTAKIELKVILPAEWRAEVTAETAGKPAATAH
jgi:TolB-like protein/Flp pilus assembly protein TadD